jgi:cystathionine beta-lyase
MTTTTTTTITTTNTTKHSHCFPSLQGRKLVTVDLCLGRLNDHDLAVVEGTNNALYYRINFDALRARFAADNVKLLVWCSPHNPSGRVWSRQELTRVIELAREFGVKIISDEIHSDLVLPSSGKKHVPLALVARSLGYENMVMTMSGPGKTWNLAGCHSGFVVMESPEMRKRYMEVVGHAYLSYGSVFATTTMLAAYANAAEVEQQRQQRQQRQQQESSVLGSSTGANTMTDPASWLEDVLQYLDGNIDALEQFVVERLPRIRVMRPEASFLVWLDCRRMGMASSQQLESFFTDKAKVFLSSGSGFGGKSAAGFMRINVACPRSFLLGALKRIARAYESVFPAGAQ